MSLVRYLIRPNILSLKLQLAERLCLQAAQKTSQARRATFDELRRTLRYVEGVGRAQRAYESFQQAVRSLHPCLFGCLESACDSIREHLRFFAARVVCARS